MFYKIGALENVAKSQKTPMSESLSNKVAHMLPYDLYEIFKNTYFPITPQNQATFLAKQVSKVT